MLTEEPKTETKAETIAAIVEAAVIEAEQQEQHEELIETVAVLEQIVENQTQQQNWGDEQRWQQSEKINSLELRIVELGEQSANLISVLMELTAKLDSLKAQAEPVILVTETTPLTAQSSEEEVDLAEEKAEAEAEKSAETPPEKPTKKRNWL